MQDTGGGDSPSRPPIVPPTMGPSATSATVPQARMTELREEGNGLRMNDQQLEDGDLPCKNLVDALGLPSTIGTAVAAGALFTVITADQAQYNDAIAMLALSGFFFALATANTICLQALYSSPSFCRILYKKLNRDPKRRTKFEPWPSWDFMRYVVAYFTVVWAYASIVLHMIATMIIFQLFTFNGHTYPSQVTFGLACFVCVVIWVISVLLERPKRLRDEEISAV
ncbi:hypothetical protein FRC00_013290 [Tulasnella sp. 408]|nr:hypothetical protein FRC00_013290 [Tulasnella sp. 408]